MRTMLGWGVSILVVFSPALSRAGCDGSASEEVASQYFGLGDYRGMTETQIHQKLIDSPDMQRWRNLAEKNGVGAAIASWIVDLGHSEQ